MLSIREVKRKEFKYKYLFLIISVIYHFISFSFFQKHGEFLVKDNTPSYSDMGTTWKINPLLVKGNQ